MHKLQFLCSNHRAWLSSNPRAAINTWRTSYCRSLDLAEEEDYLAAARYAGAAFESAEITLSHPWQSVSTGIGRFAETTVLLVQLLYRLQEPRLAAGVMGAALARLERMLVVDGVDRVEVLAGCERMQRMADELLPSGDTDHLLAEQARALLH